MTPRALRPHEELVLLVAGTTARRRANAGRVEALLGQVAWGALLAELAAQRLVPLLGGRVLELAGTRAPDRVRRCRPGRDRGVAAGRQR